MVTHAIWDNTVLAAFHARQVNALRFNPSQTGRYLIYLFHRDGRLS